MVRQRSQIATVANMDAIQGKKGAISGMYKLTPVGDSLIAKMDEIMVEIRSVSMGYGSWGGDCK